MHVRTHDIKTLFEIQTHQFVHLCALRGFVKKERWRMGRPKADPEAAKPDVLVPKSCLPLVVLFHRSIPNYIRVIIRLYLALIIVMMVYLYAHVQSRVQHAAFKHFKRNAAR